MLLETGQLVDGKYRIMRLIGTGGMGAVYEGENVLIRRRVAIKVLNAECAGNEDVLRRFEREAQAAGEIGDDHILEVLDLGSLPGGDRYMVMEYLDGETLAVRIERHGQLSPEQVAPIARQFLAALASAHAVGIIHRDLKPENIFILRSKAGRPDFVKLIDFGISKFSRRFKEGEHRMTRAGAVFGTPCYMSPEQARGAAEADVRSDIYSCGVILFEAVTGRLPFEADSFNALMFKIALSDAPSPTSFVPALDPAFAAIVERAIARDPAARFASVDEFAQALDDWMIEHVPFDAGTFAASSGDAFAARVTTTPGPASRGSLVHTGPTRVVEAGPAADLGGAPRLVQKSGANDSWAHSNVEAPPKKRSWATLALASAGGVALLALSVGLVVHAASPRAAAAARGASAGTAPLAAVPSGGSVAAGVRVAPVSPGGGVARSTPAPMSAPAATATEPATATATATADDPLRADSRPPSSAEPRTSDPAAEPSASGEPAARKRAASVKTASPPPAPTVKAKPKAALVSKGFDLGY